MSVADCAEDPENADKQGHCPNCGAMRYVQVLKAHVNKFGDKTVSGWDKFQIVQCRGCRTIFFMHEAWFSENDDEDEPTYYPSPMKWKEPEWTFKIYEKEVRSMLKSVYNVLNSDENLVLACLGIRTCFELAVIQLGIEAETFGGKVNELVSKGWIGSSEKELLDKLIEVGNASVHRGWVPSEETVAMVLSYLERILQLVIARREHKDIQVPPRKK